MAPAGDYREVAGFSLESAAVVVVDMTNDFGHPDGVYARHGLACPPLEEIVPGVARLLDSARAAGTPVILCSQIVHTLRDGRAIAAPGLTEARPWLVEEGLRRGSWGTRMIDALGEPDLTIEKPRASGFFATALDLVLRGLGIDTVIVVGGFTDQCVVSTVRDAWALDYRVVLPPDGCAAFDPARHEATLASLVALAAQPSLADLVRRLDAARPG